MNSTMEVGRVAAAARTRQRHRILTKLAAVWALPVLEQDTLGRALSSTVEVYAPEAWTFGPTTPDSEVEAALDDALKHAGVQVEGWKS